MRPRSGRTRLTTVRTGHSINISRDLESEPRTTISKPWFQLAAVMRLRSWQKNSPSAGMCRSLTTPSKRWVGTGRAPAPQHPIRSDVAGLDRAGGDSSVPQADRAAGAGLGRRAPGEVLLLGARGRRAGRGRRHDPGNVLQRKGCWTARADLRRHAPKAPGRRNRSTYSLVV